MMVIIFTDVLFYCIYFWFWIHLGNRCNSKEIKHFIEGYTATFHCPYTASSHNLFWSGPPELTKYSANTEINQDVLNRDRLSIHAFGKMYNLSIRNFTNADAGTYQCSTVVDGLVKEYTIEAKIAAKPALVQNSSKLKYESEVGTSTTITLAIDSFSKPEVAWTTTSGGTRGLWNVSSDKQESFIISSSIVPIIDEHIGLYGVKVRNNVGSIDLQLMLFSTFVEVFPTTQRCNISSTMKVGCTITVQDASRWRNEWLHMYKHTVIRILPGKIENNQSVLTIPYCDYHDIGQYVCKWTLDSRVHTAACDAAVQGYPVLAKKMSLIRDGVLSLDILFYSMNQPDSILWFYNDILIPKEDIINTSIQEIDIELNFFGKHIIIKGFIASLTTSILALPNDTLYSCQIKNIFGVLEASFERHLIDSAWKNMTGQASRGTFPIERHVLLIGGPFLMMVLLVISSLLLYYIKRAWCTRSNENMTIAVEQEIDNLNVTMPVNENVLPNVDYEEIDPPPYFEPIMTLNPVLSQNTVPVSLETEQECVTESSSSSNASSSSLGDNSSTSDAIYLDVIANKYETLNKSNAERHDYSTC